VTGQSRNAHGESGVGERLCFVAQASGHSREPVREDGSNRAAVGGEWLRFGSQRHAGMVAWPLRQ
jgi:hypothetical protein